jgi:thiol-disulfide isomerase/thioredoxin
MKKLPRILLLVSVGLFSSISLLCCKKETVAESIPQPKTTRVYSKDGISINSYDFKAFESFLKMQNDTTYVVNFWATWCQPCVEELPNFEKLNAEYQSQKVKVILVSLDMRKQVESNLIRFIQKRNIKSQVIHLSDPDANAWISKVDSAWSGAIPATVIYNKGKRKFYEQSFTFDQLKDELTRRLKNLTQF